MRLFFKQSLNATKNIEISSRKVVLKQKIVIP